MTDEFAKAAALQLAQQVFDQIACDEDFVEIRKSIAKLDLHVQQLAWNQTRFRRSGRLPDA